MDRLPEEIIIFILSFLPPADITTCQLVCRRLLLIARDNNLWKAICFDNSQTDTIQRRLQALADQEARLTTLREAIIESFAPHPEGNGPAPVANEARNTSDKTSRRQRAFANWDPAYPFESTNFYEEYIHRHAEISLSYFQQARDLYFETEPYRESLGIGTLKDDVTGEMQKIMAPLDDGSICIWDAARDSPSRGRIIARTAAGKIDQDLSKSSMKVPKLSAAETGAVDNISIDNRQQKAFVASENILHEVDINTLGIVRSQTFPFPITALSEARSPMPLTVGTNMTLHLFDIRVNRPQLDLSPSTRCELIAGSPTINGTAGSVSSKHVSLSQPGPLSILHLPSLSNHSEPSDSIWVAGRFTSLLHYDRRFWPKVQGTIFSGARLSGISYLTYPFINPQLRSPFSHPWALRNAKKSSGLTIIAAGEYKGKGSLELYGVPEVQDSAIPQHYHNRQYASKSRLLSVAPHGTRIVFSDGDGLLKWVERDAWTVVRTFNINTANGSSFGAASAQTPSAISALRPQDSAPSQRAARTAPRSIFAAQPSDDPDSDIVRKILPMSPNAPLEVNTRDLMILTGDGKIGLVEFGRKSARPFNEQHDENGTEHAGSAEAVEQERVYADRMREALERQADEARFVRGLGLGR